MVAFNAVSQLTAFGVILLLQAVYMILVARVVGPEDFGRFSFAWTIVHMMLVGGDLGLHNTVLRRISRDPQSSLAISRTFFWLKGLLALFLFVLILAVAVWIRESSTTCWMLVIFGMGMVFHSISAAMNVVFQAHGRLYLASLNNLVVFGGSALIGLSILFLGGRLIALSTAYLVSSLIGVAVNHLVFVRTIHAFRVGKGEGWKDFARESIPVGLGNLFSVVSRRIAIALLTVLAGPLQTGFFSAASRIPMVLRNIPLCILSAVLPLMAAHQEQSLPIKRLLVKLLLILSGLSLPFSIAFYLFAEPLIRLLYGQEYDFSIDTLRVLTWSLVPMFLGMAFGHVVLSQNRLVGRMPWVAGTALLVSLTANLLFIPRYGSQGAAVAVLVTEVALAGGYVMVSRRFLFQNEDAR